MVIIGAGPAGLSSSIYLARAGLKPLIVGKPHNSQLEKSHQVGNYLGWVDFEGIPGKDIINSCLKHVKKYKVPLIEEEVVNAQSLDDGSFLVKTHSLKEFKARGLIIACGVSYLTSRAENEEKFVGKGVHYCVACDGFFYKGKKVVVLGNGNYAAEEALELSNLTKDVTIISQKKGFEISSELMNALKAKGITLRDDFAKFIEGKDFVETIATSKGAEPVNGVFVAVGTASTMAFANKLGLEREGQFIKIDRDGRTNLKRVYAAGACTGGNIQMAKSVGEGCNAAITVIKDLSDKLAYTDYT